MRNLVIVMGEKPSFDEVVDTVADVLELGVMIEKDLEDGFQPKDLLNAFQIHPVVNEVINDFPIFVKQFLALDGETSKKAVLEAKQRIGKTGKVTSWIMKFLFVAASNYDYAMKGKNEYDLWKSFIEGNDVFDLK